MVRQGERGDPVRSGRGVTIFFNEQNFMHIKVWFGMGTNHFVELMACRLLLTKACEWGARSIQIYGDSKIILDWADEIHRCNIL